MSADGPDPHKPVVGVLVLGMRRSGSSMVSRLLHQAGLEGPGKKSSIPPDHPEVLLHSKAIQDFNDSLLARSNMSWNSILGNTSELDFSEADIEEAKSIIREQFTLQATFFISDPRICLLLKFWVEVFRRLDVDLKILRIVRSPNSVADSIERHFEMSRDKAVALWVKYNLQLEKSTKALDCTTIGYDAFLQSNGAAVFHFLKSIKPDFRPSDDPTMGALVGIDDPSSNKDTFRIKVGGRDHDLAEMYYESIESDLINEARYQLEIVYSPIISGFDALKPNAEAQVISNVNEEVLAEVLAKSANIAFESHQRLLEVNHLIARMSELQESRLDTNDELNSQLSNLQNHAETLERHIHNIENSKSWRWTKPLRSILGFLRRLG